MWPCGVGRDSFIMSRTHSTSGSRSSGFSKYQFEGSVRSADNERLFSVSVDEWRGTAWLDIGMVAQ